MNELVVPEDLDFADLEIEREPKTDRLLFRPEPIARVAAANGQNPAEVLASEDLSMWFIMEWYVAHLGAGGAIDPVLQEYVDQVEPGAPMQ